MELWVLKRPLNQQFGSISGTKGLFLLSLDSTMNKHKRGKNGARLKYSESAKRTKHGDELFMKGDREIFYE